MSRSHRSLIIFLLAAIIACSAIVIYLPTLKSGFIWDDVQLLINPLKIGESPYFFFFSGKIYYRPFLHLSMALDYSLWHLNPFGYHATNIFLHAVNSLLVFLICFHLMKDRKMMRDTIEIFRLERTVFFSFLAAMFFALHPIHTESVAWISGRTDVLATLFFLLAFLSFLIYAREDTTAGLVLSCTFFLSSLFAKENAVAFIGVVFVYGIMTRMSKKKLIFSFLSLSFVLGLYFFLRGWDGGVRDIVAPAAPKDSFFVTGISLENFLKVLVNGTGYYFEKLILPFNLNLLPQIPDNSLYLVIVLLAFIIGIILYFTGHTVKAFLITWVIITLLPSLSILYSQMAAPIGERYLYLPSVGFSIFLAAVLVKIKGKKLAVLTVLIILAAYSISTSERLKVWKDEVTLWEDTARKNANSDPNAVTAHLNYGASLARIGEFGKAKEMLIIALNQKKISFQQVASILNLLGMIEINDKNYKKAEEYLTDSIKADPKNAETFNNLGFLYSILMDEPGIGKRQKNELLERALKNFHRALSLSKNFLQAKYNLGICYLRKGDLNNAERYLNAVIESDPQGDYARKAATFLVVIELSKRNDVKDSL